MDLIVSGIETSNGATGTGSGECGNASVTFFEEGQNAMNLELGCVFERQSINPSFRGFAIHHYNDAYFVDIYTPPNSWLLGNLEFPKTPNLLLCPPEAQDLDVAP